MNRLLAKAVKTLLAAGFAPQEVKNVTTASGSYINYYRKMLGITSFPRGPKPDLYTSDLVESMLLSGRTPFEIRTELGVAGSSVSSYRRKLGLQPFKRGRKPGRTQRVLETEKEVRRLKVQGLTYREIGKRMGFSYQRAQQYLMLSAPKLNGQSCEVCGGTEKVGRHHVDYKTDEIQFLCFRCHGTAAGKAGRVEHANGTAAWFLDNKSNPTLQEVS